MSITIMKEFSFAGAHMLPHHEGKCRNLHGHEWKVKVYVRRRDGGVIESGPSQGMVIDFGDLKDLLKKHVEQVFDHTYLNERFQNPTAENIAEWIRKELTDALCPPAVVLVKRVEVWETPTSCAIAE